MSDVEVKSRPAGRGVALLMAMFLAGAIAFGWWQHRPPSPAPQLAPPEAFSGARAVEHVRAFATKPHPIGTAANAAVAEYIRNAVSGLGVELEIQEAVHHRVPGHVTAVRNLLARIPGTSSAGAIALCGHYDSVAFGPGAADDGSGVATLLETMRALKSSPPLQNDVIFVFSDGEEGRSNNGIGLSGARAFAEQHPWAKSVRVVVNFDARGTGGVSYMYETSPENGWLIGQLAQAECRPVATSFMGDVYHSLPLGSDFTGFLEQGIAGYNCAFVDGLRRYHTALDTPENLSVASVQQDGDYALGLTRRLGNLSLENVRGPDMVYFNTLGYRLAYYPKTLAVPLAGVSCGACALALLIGLFRRRITLRPLIRGAFVYLGFLGLMFLLSAVIVGYGCWTRWVYILYTENWLTFGLMALAAFTLVANLSWITWKAGVANLAAGALLSWAGLAVASAFLAPGGSYLTAWPLLFSSLGLALYFLGRDPVRVSPFIAGILALTALPGIILMTGMMAGLNACLTVIFAPVTVCMGTLLLGLLIPHLHLARSRWGWLLSIALAGLTGFCFWQASMTSGFSPAYPKLDSLTYGLDATTGRAFWMSCDDVPDNWNAAYLPADTKRAGIKEFFPGSTKLYLKAPAPPVALAPPEITLSSDHTEQGVRTLQLRVNSPRQATILELYAGEDMEVHSASVDGRDLKPVEGRWFLKYNAFPAKGIELTLKTNPSTPAILKVVDHSYGFPELPGLAVAPRPNDRIPKPNTVDANKDPLKTDETLVAKTYVF